MLLVIWEKKYKMTSDDFLDAVIGGMLMNSDGEKDRYIVYTARYS